MRMHHADAYAHTAAVGPADQQHAQLWCTLAAAVIVMPKQWHISQLCLSAFKSFAEPTTFDVPSHQLVGITGPNGCGKSNLLEALCFAAGCPASDLRGSLLKDCQSSDEAAQLCSVQLVVSNGVQAHTLLTSLTSDGSRSYKLDGKLRTGSQVKEFLRSKGITIDGNTVIRQATVTHLADSSDGDWLSKVVANASGLSRWREQASLAAAEVQRTRQALQHIAASTQQLQAAIGGDTARLQALQQAQCVRRELLGVLQQLVQTQQSQLQQLAQEAVGAQAALREELQQHQQQLIAQQQQVDQSASQAAAAAAGLQDVISSVQTLQQQLLLAEHGCKLMQQEADAAASRQQQLQRQQQGLDSLQQQQEALQQQLAVAQQDAGRLQALLDSAAQAGSIAQQQAHQVALLQQQATESAAAVEQQQVQVGEDQQQLTLAEQQLAGLRQQVQQVADAAGVTCEQVLRLGAQSTSGGRSGPLVGLQQSVRQCQQQLLAADVKASQLQAQLSNRAVQTLQHMLSTNSSRPAGSTPSAHSSRSGAGGSSGRALGAADLCCVSDAFTVHNAADPQVQQLAPALAAICSIGTLGVVLAESGTAVQQVLGALAAAGRSWRHGKVRLWPLDELQVRDMTRQQQAAQAGLGADKVLLPLDVLEYPAQYRAAVQRAFGGYVIAVDDATASKVVTQYGLNCVTLQGTVSRKGSMSGGWAAPQANPSLQRWQRKLQADAAVQLQQQLQGSLQRLQQQLEQEEGRLAQQQQAASLLQQVKEGEARRAAAAAQHAAAMLLLQQLQQQAEQCQVRQQQQEADGHAGGGRPPAEVQGDLKEQHHAAAERVAALETQLEALAEQVDELCAAVEAAALQAPSAAPQQLQDQQQELARLQDSLRAAQKQQEEQAAIAQLLQQRHVSHQHQLQSLKENVLELEQQLLERQEVAAAAAAGADAVLTRLQELLQEFPHLQLPMVGGSSATAASQLNTTGAAPAAQQADSKEVGRLEQQLRRLQRQLEAEGREEVSTADQVLAQQRLQQLSQLQEQAAALTAAAAALQHHIEAAEVQVAAAHQAVLLEVAEGFHQLCGSLLPSLEVQLVTAGAAAAAGGGGDNGAGGAEEEPAAAAVAAAGSLQLRFRLRTGVGDAAPDAPGAPAPPSSSWQTSLQQLSGGQRTLVSLAFLLATGRAGCSSRLLLLDEVDAALDEHNQRRVAELLRQLASGTGSSSGCEETGPRDKGRATNAKRRLDSSSAGVAGSGSCQILCISHNAAFQATCHAQLPISSRDGRKAPAAAASARPAQAVAEICDLPVGPSAPAGKKKAAAGAAGRRGAAAKTARETLRSRAATTSKPRRGQKRVTFAELSDVD